MDITTGRKHVFAAAAVVAAATALAAGADGALAAEKVPCTSIGQGKHNCHFYPPGDGESAGTPVVASDGQRVGYLNAGTNYVLCQQAGATQRSDRYYNHWWAYTKANNGRDGWANAVFARGGANNGAFGGVPNCNGSKGSPPSGAVESPRAPAVGPACSKTRENRRVTIGVSFRYRHQLSNYSNGRLFQKVYTDSKRRFGKIVVGGVTCNQRGKKGWKLLSPVGVGYTSKGLSAGGAIRGKGLTRGWGIGIRKGAGGSSPTFKLQLMHCGKGVFWKNVKELAGLPWPFLKYTYTVAIWIGGKFLPEDKIKCANNGYLTIRVSADKHGRLRVKAADHSVTESWSYRDRPTDNLTSKSYPIESVTVKGS